MKMMRKFFLWLVVAILTAMPIGAQAGAQENIAEIVETLYKVYEDAYNQKDYRAAIRAVDDMVKRLDELDMTEAEREENEKMLNRVKSGLYYDKACAYSLLNDRKNALRELERAIGFGYQDYAHLTTDTDFDNLKGDKRFQKLARGLQKYDKRFILASSAKYRQENTDTLPRFWYQESDDRYLRHTREFFKLDSVAGTGDEVSKIISILHYVHNTIRHDGSNFAVCEGDALDIYNYHKATGKGVNCRQLAIALNGMYLAMGFPSRFVTCMPKDADDPDCHVICCVYSAQLGKWLWMDPTFNAYVKDDKGNLLSIEEVRERIINQQPLVLNDDANWNNERKTTKQYYLDYYMAKNLYWLNCSTVSCFNPEPRYGNIAAKYVALVPPGFNSKATRRSFFVFTSDPNYFWQKP